MNPKKHNLVYKITNIINGKIYIGRHVTNKLDDGYMGSGFQIQKAIEKYGIENFIKEILFDYDNIEDMMKKEAELVCEEFVNRSDVYNVSMGGPGGTGMLGKTHSEEVRNKLRELYTNTVLVYDSDRNYFRVPVDDPRYLSGELKHNLHGTVCVKDSDGNKFRVPVDDERRLSGELIGANVGSTRPPETIEKHIEFMTEYWKNNKHSPEAIEKMRSANKGKVNVKDKDGNEFRVSIDDPRIMSGELVNARKGMKASVEKRARNSEIKSGCIWISNAELKKTKLIKPDDAVCYLQNGWIAKRVFFK
jgi:group I intron endonuclease